MSRFLFRLTCWDAGCRWHPNIWMMLPSVLWHYWLCIRKSTWPIKMSDKVLGMVICLERSANDLHKVYTDTHTHNHFMALRIFSGTTRVSWYQKKHFPLTPIMIISQSYLICFLQLLRSMASSLFNLHTWQSSSPISVQVFFCLPLGLAPSTSYSMQFFTQSLPIPSQPILL